MSIQISRISVIVFNTAARFLKRIFRIQTPEPDTIQRTKNHFPALSAHPQKYVAENQFGFTHSFTSWQAFKNGPGKFGPHE